GRGRRGTGRRGRRGPPTRWRAGGRPAGDGPPRSTRGPTGNRPGTYDGPRGAFPGVSGSGAEVGAAAPEGRGSRHGRAGVERSATAGQVLAEVLVGRVDGQRDLLVLVVEVDLGAAVGPHDLGRARGRVGHRAQVLRQHAAVAVDEQAGGPHGRGGRQPVEGEPVQPRQLGHLVHPGRDGAAGRGGVVVQLEEHARLLVARVVGGHGTNLAGAL